MARRDVESRLEVERKSDNEKRGLMEKKGVLDEYNYFGYQHHKVFNVKRLLLVYWLSQLSGESRIQEQI